jgi:hypothetical protein
MLGKTNARDNKQWSDDSWGQRMVANSGDDNDDESRGQQITWMTNCGDDEQQGKG